MYRFIFFFLPWKIFLHYRNPWLKGVTIKITIIISIFFSLLYVRCSVLSDLMMGKNFMVHSWPVVVYKNWSFRTIIWLLTENGAIQKWDFIFIVVSKNNLIPGYRTYNGNKNFSSLILLYIQKEVPAKFCLVLEHLVKW